MKTYNLEFRPNKKKKGELVSMAPDGKYVFMHKKHTIKPFKTYKCIEYKTFPKYMIVELAPSLFRQFINFISFNKNS